MGRERMGAPDRHEFGDLIGKLDVLATACDKCGRAVPARALPQAPRRAAGGLIRRMTDAAAHDWYSISLWAAGHPDEALQEVDLAHRRDPLSGCRGQEPWQWRAAIRMSHLGNSSSKCD